MVYEFMQGLPSKLPLKNLKIFIKKEFFSQKYLAISEISINFASQFGKASSEELQIASVAQLVRAYSTKRTTINKCFSSSVG